MFDKLRRRTFLGGTVGAITGLSGCGSQEDVESSEVPDTAIANATNFSTENHEEKADTPDEQDQLPRHDHSGDDQGGATLNPEEISATHITADSISAESVEVDDIEGHATATLIVEQREDETRCRHPPTGKILAAAPVNEEDGRIIQTAFDSLRHEYGGKGSVFIRNGVYEIRESYGSSEDTFDGLRIVSDRTRVYSDFATLRFGYHSDVDVQRDLRVSEKRDVLISGLILDGDRQNRHTMTITLQVSDCENVTVRDCVIYGGSAGQAKQRGYGVAVGRNNGFTFENCVVEDAERHGIHPGGRPDKPDRKTRILNCTFRNNASYRTGAAVDIRSYSQDAIVENCVFENNGRAVMVKGESVENAQIRGNIFRNNMFVEDPDVRAQVALAVDEGFTTVGIHDNQFVQTKSYDRKTAQLLTHFSNGGDTVEVKGNHFRGSDVPIWGEGETPIDLLILDNNTVVGHGRSLMELRQADTLVMTGNRLEGAGPPASVSVGDSVQNGVVSNNILLNAEFQGVGSDFESFDNVSL